MTRLVFYNNQCFGLSHLKVVSFFLLVSYILTFIIVYFIDESWNYILKRFGSKILNRQHSLWIAAVSQGWALYCANVWLKQTKREYFPVVACVELKDVYVLLSLLLWLKAKNIFFLFLCLLHVSVVLFVRRWCGVEEPWWWCNTV